MSGSFFGALTVAAALASQMPAVNRARQGIDPIMPPELTETIAAASKAELDPRRGTANALEILKAAKPKHAGVPFLRLALDLRIAATVLRATFLNDKKTPEPVRYERVLSTFSRLDLFEPGLRPWLQRAVAHHPEAKKALGKKRRWRIKGAILTRGSMLDRKALGRLFTEALAKAGVRLQIVPAKEASMILKVAAEGAAPKTEGRRAVKIQLGLESIRNNEVVWRHSIYRTEEAEEPEVAMQSALDWMARIGGRDLLFRWLGETAFHSLAETGLGRPTDQEHQHGGISPVGRPERTRLKARIPQIGKKPEARDNR